MVQLIGVDWYDDDPQYGEVYKVSMQFSMGKTSDGGKTDNDLSTVTGTGPNLYSAVKEARSVAAKEFFFTHNQVLILGEQVIKNNPITTLEQYLDYCDDHSTALVAGCYGKAEEIIALTYKDEYSDKNKIKLILENANNTALFPAYAIYETLMGAYSESESCFIPMLKVEDDRSASSGKSSGKSSEGESGDEGSDGGVGAGSPNAAPAGGAVIISDKAAFFMNEEQCKGLSLLVNTSDIANVKFLHEDFVYSLEIFKKKTKIIPRFDGEKLVFHVKFSAFADRGHNPIMETCDRDEFERLSQEAIVAKLKDAVEATVRIGGDVILLEDSVKHYDYSAWLKVEDDWYEAMKNAEFVYSAKIKMQ